MKKTKKAKKKKFPLAALSEKALMQVWDNKEDDVYEKYLDD
ncbi:MAG: hypothetical protein ABH854_00240 [Candidatus Diapherotrites archaeon]